MLWDKLQNLGMLKGRAVTKSDRFSEGEEAGALQVREAGLEEGTRKGRRYFCFFLHTPIGSQARESQRTALKAPRSES